MEIYVKFRKLTLKKNSKKMHKNLNKYKAEIWLALLRQNLISTCNHRVKYVPAGRVEISSQQTRII